MARYRWEGVRPLPRDSGESIKPGGAFEATEREHARIQRRQTPGFVLLADEVVEVEEVGAGQGGVGAATPVLSFPTQPQPEVPAHEPEAVGEGVAVGAGDEVAQDENDSAEEGLAEEEEQSAPEWVLKMPPGEYLKAYPSGPNAALARQVLGLGE